MDLSPRVSALLGAMSLEEKAGQVFIFTFHNLRQAVNDLRLQPGGYIRVYGDALTTASQNRTLQGASKIPLILSADFERGVAQSVYGGVDLAGNMCLGAAGDERLAFETGRVIAAEARAIGINMNYVPVLDVNVNEANPIINVRSFGEDPDLVARLGAAMVRGSREGGVLTCGKHFPGHGDTHIDSHASLGVIEASRQRLDRVELVPFRRAIEAHVDAIMSSHLRIPAIDPDPVPATMSRKVMHDLLRQELGFTGLIVSDAMDMGGITKHFGTDEAIVRAFNAGCDQLIMPIDNARSVNCLVRAVAKGEVSERRLDEAVTRILTLKEAGGLFEASGMELSRVAGKLNKPEHYRLAREVALAGITLVRDEQGVLPLDHGRGVAVITFSNCEDSRSAYLDPKSIGSHCARYGGPGVRTVNCGMLDARMVGAGVVERALEAAAETSVVVLGAFTRVVVSRGSSLLEDRYTEFTERICQIGKPMVLVSFGNPYLIKQFPRIGTCICAYGSSEATQEAMSMLLYGQLPFRGTLPITITLNGANCESVAGNAS